MSEIDDFDDDNFEEDTDAKLVDEVKAKPLEKRLKIDALLEQQRLKKLEQALEQEDDFAEFDLDDDFDDFDDF
ncbi:MULTISPECIES: PA3496 family putative envelope integrity protein [unclassified Moraxella]